MKDHELLGVPEDATADAIKAAYYTRAQELHPDKGGSAEAFNQLHQAYGRLLERAVNPTKKRCTGCRGRGKVPKTKGFHVINQPCADCKGKGVR